MMAQPVGKKRVTLEKYLEVDTDTNTRYEYVDGHIVAMTGASLNHNRIQQNISRVLGNQLYGRECDVLSNDMRVKIEQKSAYVYPDIVVACDKVQLESGQFDTLLNPVVIIEVLSNSTEAYDRGTKFRHYRMIPTLQDYLLISQYECLVEKYSRGESGIWQISNPYTEMVHVIGIDAIDCELTLSEIYYRVEFEEK